VRGLRFSAGSRVCFLNAPAARLFGQVRNSQRQSLGLLKLGNGRRGRVRGGKGVSAPALGHHRMLEWRPRPELNRRPTA
jgi:hypothetical protein